MTKTPRTHKFSTACLSQIAWLRKRLGLASDTAVLEHAVAELHTRKQAEFRQRLVPSGNHYDLMVGSTVVASVGKQLFSSLPAKLQTTLLDGGDIPGFAILLLTQARSGKGYFSINWPAVNSIIGGGK